MRQISPFSIQNGDKHNTIGNNVAKLNNPIVLKLGGSVITHKASSPPRVNYESLRRISREIGAFGKPLILVLGGGAHGHQPAKRYGFGNPSTPSKKRLDGIPEIRHNMNLLASQVETTLSENQVKSIIIPPMAISNLRNGRINFMYLTSMRNALQAGITIVTHGDVCFDETQGAAILSGDTLCVYLAQKLEARAVFLGTDVDGIMTGNPDTNPEAELISEIVPENKEKILNAAGPSKSTDVTGGMNRKVRELLALTDNNIEVTIFNLNIPGRLGDLLSGKQIIGTRIKA